MRYLLAFIILALLANIVRFNNWTLTLLAVVLIAGLIVFGAKAMHRESGERKAQR